MYPMLKDGVKLGYYMTEDDEPDGFYVENPMGDTFTIDQLLYEMLTDADGAHDFYAYGLPPERVQRLIRRLKREDIITTSRLLPGFPFSRYILIPVGARGTRFKRPCTAVNRVLPFACLALLAAGLFRVAPAMEVLLELEDEMLLYLFLLASLALHEAGHFCAAVAYDCEVSDVGLLLLGILPLGAYVGYQRKDLPRRKSTQIALAGVEVNLALVGLCLLLAASPLLPPAAAALCSATGILNLLLGVFNLVPAMGLDGEMAISALLGIPSFENFVSRLLGTRRTRDMLVHGGVEGAFWLAVCLIQILCRLFVIAMILYSLWCLVAPA